jgi:uncharacterized membrane protein YjgN (DUF898 family)
MNIENPLPEPESAPAERAVPVDLPLRFVGSGSEYFRIWIVNLLLILVTFGLYYPFAKVRRMKYFHGATELAGQPFGYHAEPWKMFRGYLLVGAMVGLYSVAGQFSPTAGLIAFVIVAAIWPLLWHSSLRFRFANTSWRGLRFHFRGTAGGAYKTLAVPTVASLAFVGFALMLGPDPDAGPNPASPAAAFGFLAAMLVFICLMPWFIFLTHRYRQHHLGLGREDTAYRATVWGYYKLNLKTSLVSLLPFLLLGVMLAVVVPALQRDEQTGGPSAFAMFPLVLLFYVVLLSTAGGYFTARLQRLMWNGTASPHIGFNSALKARSLIGLWVKNWLLIVFTLGLYFPFAQVATARLRLEAMTVTSALPLDELTALLDSGRESAAGDAAGDLLGFDIGL